MTIKKFTPPPLKTASTTPNVKPPVLPRGPVVAPRGNVPNPECLKRKKILTEKIEFYRKLFIETETSFQKIETMMWNGHRKFVQFSLFIDLAGDIALIIKTAATSLKSLSNLKNASTSNNVQLGVVMSVAGDTAEELGKELGGFVGTFFKYVDNVTSPSFWANMVAKAKQGQGIRGMFKGNAADILVQEIRKVEEQHRSIKQTIRDAKTKAESELKRLPC